MSTSIADAAEDKMLFEGLLEYILSRKEHARLIEGELEIVLDRV